MDQPLPPAVALEESSPHQERGELVCNTPLIRIMTEQLPLTDPLFATEDESNIINNPPLPLAVAQEESNPNERGQLVCSTPLICMTEQLPLTDPFFAAEQESNIIHNMVQELRLDHETAQLVCSTPHRPRQRMKDGERVHFLPFPVQATMHFGGYRDELVCPPLPRN